MNFRFLPVHFRHLWSATGVVFTPLRPIFRATGVVFDTCGGLFRDLQVSFLHHSYLATPTHFFYNAKNVVMTPATPNWWRK